MTLAMLGFIQIPAAVVYGLYLLGIAVAAAVAGSAVTGSAGCCKLNCGGSNPGPDPNPDPEECPPLQLSFYAGHTPDARLLEGHNLTVGFPYGSDQTFFARRPADSSIGYLSAYTNAYAYCTGEEDVLLVSGMKYCRVDQSGALSAGTFNPRSGEFYIQDLKEDVSVVLQGQIPGVETPCRYFVDIDVDELSPR